MEGGGLALTSPLGAPADLGPTLWSQLWMVQDESEGNNLLGKNRTQSLIHDAECKSMIHPPQLLWP